MNYFFFPHFTDAKSYVDKGVIKCQRGSIWGSQFYYCMKAEISFRYGKEKLRKPLTFKWNTLQKS